MDPKIVESVEKQAGRLYAGNWSQEGLSGILVASALLQVAEEVRGLRDSLDFFIDQYRQKG